MAMSEGGQASRVARSAVDTTRRGSNASPVARHAIVGLSAAFAVMLVSGATATGSGLETVGLLAASRPVAFVPLGDFPRSDAMSLARHYERTLGLETRVLPRSDIPKSAFNQARKQYVAEKLIDVVASRRNAGNARDVLVGLTTRDMHTRDIPNWRFTFSIRHPSGLAVVSRARMDPRLLGLSPDPVLRMRRLRKMVLKNIGLLALGLSQSQDPRSALYDVILSTDDLDYMTEELKPRTPSRANRAWLSRANSACERGIVEGKALLARSPIATPADVLAFGRESIVLEERTRARLAGIAVPPEDRGAIKALLALFQRSVNADRSFVAKLTARWNEETLRRWLEEGVRDNVALKSKALELGSRGCGRYFDPATYVR